MPVRYSSRSLPRNPPKKPANTRLQSKQFPSDLIQPGRNFYIRIGFTKYSFSISNFIGSTASSNQGSVILPIPSSLADVQVLSWEQNSVLAFGQAVPGVAAATTAAAAVGVKTGNAPNPGLFMMFRQPNFKEYTFSWDMVADNQRETDTIAEIVDFIKNQSSPKIHVTGGFYEYPHIAVMKLYPDDKYTFRMKPAAITSVQVQYNGAGQPAFLRNGAPVHVKLTISFKEIQIWEKNSWGGSNS